MEKYSALNEDLIEGLRNEEHALMLQISRYMSLQEKTAQEDDEYRRTQARLQHIRDKITELDLKKIGLNG